MFQKVVILVFTTLASSFLWWRSRFKICRRCRSRIRRWASICHVCGAEQVSLAWPYGSPQQVSSSFPLLYITCTWRLGGCGIAEFSSLSKRSEGVPPGLNKVNDDNFAYASVSNHRTKQPTGLLVCVNLLLQSSPLNGLFATVLPYSLRHNR